MFSVFVILCEVESVESNQAGQVQAILIIQLRQLGDILLTTPIIEALRQRFPSARLAFLSHKMGRLILKDNPFIDDHIVYHEESSIRTQLELIGRLRRDHFDLVFDFMNNPRSALLTFLSGSKETWAFRSNRRLFYSRCVERPASGSYIVEEKFNLLAPMGIEYKGEKLMLPVASDVRSTIAQFFTKSSAANSDQLRVVLSPTHRRPRRQWCPQRFAAIADRLVKEWNARVFWLWGPGEKEFVEDVQSRCHEVTELAPDTSFCEMAAFIGACDVFVGTSNGPSHVAVAEDTVSLQLHGHTDARSWCPNNSRHQSLQSSEFGQPDASLMGISEEQVWMKLEKLWVLADESAQDRKV